MSGPPASERPAYYAHSTGAGGPADWWTLLHPPYTAWHLSYVVVGAAAAPRLDGSVLGATVAAFLLAMGVSAHALDELAGRPLRTGISTRALVAAAAAGLVGAIAIGLAVVGWPIVPFAAVGVALVLGYNLELAGGLLHNTAGFSLAWGTFPVLTACFAQSRTLTPAALAAGAGAFALSWTQRTLSTPARELRRRTASAHATLQRHDGTRVELDAVALRAPYEAALRALTWATVCVAVTLLLVRLAPHWS